MIIQSLLANGDCLEKRNCIGTFIYDITFQSGPSLPLTPFHSLSLSRPPPLTLLLFWFLIEVFWFNYVLWFFWSLNEMWSFLCYRWVLDDSEGRYVFLLFCSSVCSLIPFPKIATPISLNSLIFPFTSTVAIFPQHRCNPKETWLSRFGFRGNLHRHFVEIGHVPPKTDVDNIPVNNVALF